MPSQTEEGFSAADLLTRGYDAFNRRDHAALRELMVPDFQWHEAEEVPGRKVCRSAEEFAAYMQGFDRLWESSAFEPLELTPAGPERMIARVGWRGRGRAGGEEVELEIFHVWRFRDGRVSRMNAYLDERAARDAAGLS